MGGDPFTNGRYVLTDYVIYSSSVIRVPTEIRATLDISSAGSVAVNWDPDSGVLVDSVAYADGIVTFRGVCPRAGFERSVAYTSTTTQIKLYRTNFDSVVELVFSRSVR